MLVSFAVCAICSLLLQVMSASVCLTVRKTPFMFVLVFLLFVCCAVCPLLLQVMSAPVCFIISKTPFKRCLPLLFVYCAVVASFVFWHQSTSSAENSVNTTYIMQLQNPSPLAGTKRWTPPTTTPTSSTPLRESGLGSGLRCCLPLLPAGQRPKTLPAACPTSTMRPQVCALRVVRALFVRACVCVRCVCACGRVHGCNWH